jgi:hypothetical protein
MYTYNLMSSNGPIHKFTFCQVFVLASVPCGLAALRRLVGQHASTSVLPQVATGCPDQSGLELFMDKLLTVPEVDLKVIERNSCCQCC